uniref:hypothetical protein n=1 Tax=uncultured Dysgonomonas sp. TaxID=206096 RepID=UPI0026244A9F|nr:hypothetical protein [uncultured Dysgonomonas sp.]
MEVSNILNIERTGTATLGQSRFGNSQWRYMKNGNTVIIDAASGRVITIFSNNPGIRLKSGAGYFNQ